MNYKTLIGIEIHVELLTKTKAFCGCKNEFGSEVNTNCCPVCMGMPGTLPVLNEQVLKYAIMAGLSTNCSIERNTKMDRKNYFYPDLTKGYQISQFDKPLCYEGYVEIEDEDGNEKKIRLIRIHMEEDTGKSIHDVSGESLIDYNRAGVPLIEIVSYPDMNSPIEAYRYLENLKEILLFTGVSDVKMEQGSLRCDVNINVVREDGVKSNIVELKNLNSFKSALKAMEYEEKRHIELLEKGENSLKETRRWDEQNQVTISMRSKENVQDYRYFPEADIVDFVISEEYINEIRDSLPELLSEKRKRFIKEYGVTQDDATILNSSKEISTYFEKLIALTEDKQVTTNFFLSEFLRRLKDSDATIGNEKFDINQFAFLLNQISQKKINNNMAKKIFRKMFEDGIDPKEHIEKEGLTQVQDEGFILDIVKEVLLQNPQSIDDLKNGKDRAFGFLVGQVMKQSKGKANPQIVNTLLKKEIDSM